MSQGFESLGPDRVIDAAEAALGRPFTGLAAPLPSYINRVYELQAADGGRVVAKFYRPGRWSREALEDEHAFVLDCAADEIPVVAPMTLEGGGTIGEFDGIFYALFPKRSGREMELCSDEGWRRLGALVGRIHLAGSRRDAPHRLRLHPESTTIPQIKRLCAIVPPHQADRFRAAAMPIAERALAGFEGVELQRIHGDCHRANILDRPGEGLMVIDFDDMAVGPPVQDLWLLLPGHANDVRREINLLLEGYEQFLEFDDRTLRLVEILRAMRMVYFLAWCATQSDDFRFRANFPDWGSETFWNREIADLERQFRIIGNDDRMRVL